MKTKIEIKSVFGKVLFEYEKENNTIKDTIIEAVKRGADLGGADLRGADLGGAYLGGAYLGGADLRDADLGGAYLGDADLRDADLGGAYLGGAYLGGADLRDADLRGAGKINSIDDILIVGPLGYRSAYTHIYRTDKGVYVKCGCFFGTIEEFAKKVHETHVDNKYERDYIALIDYAKAHFANNDKDE